MISACVLIFLSLVAFIFWVGGLAEKPVISDVGGGAADSAPLAKDQGMAG